jgi:hypothetical protein
MKAKMIACPRVIVALVGLAALAFLLWEPHLEGRNAGATAYRVYFNDPFLAYAYASSVFFFTGIVEAYRALGIIGHGEAGTGRAARSPRRMRFCALPVAVAAIPSSRSVVKCLS